MTDTLQETPVKKRSLPGRTKAIVVRLKAHAPALRERGVVSLTLFGSRVRGDERRDSDLDILIDYDHTRPFTLYELVEIKRYLSDVVGLEAHVVTHEGFAPERLSRLLRHAVDVF